MSVLEFVRDYVNNPDAMSQYPVFLAGFVMPYRFAFLQFVEEVLMLETFTAEEWMTDETRRRYGWPQQIEASHKTFLEDYKND